MNAAQIARALEAVAADVAAYLLPNGKKSGPEWKAGSIGGEAGQSLSVRISGAKRGVWRDFAAGHDGDLLDLWCAVRCCSLAEAMREAADYLGVRVDTPEKPSKAWRRPERQSDVRKPKGAAREWLISRGLTEQTLDAFRIGERVQGEKTYAVFPYLRDGEVINAKYRNVAEKRDMRQEADAEPCLFGWHLIAPTERQAILCEGEIDAMTMAQFGMPALSCNAGAGNHGWIENDWERLLRFSDIVIAYDDDEAGHKGAMEVSRRLGFERCRICKFPGYKDANEALQAGEDGEFFWEAVKNAKSIDPPELQSFEDFMGRVKAMLYPSHDDDDGQMLTLGHKPYAWLKFRPGELTVWSGINGHGKSLFLSQVALQCAMHGARWCIWSGEMQPAMQAKRIVKQAAGLDRPAVEYIDAIGAWIRDRIWVVSHVGSASIDRLVEIFAYANRRYGCDAFVLDSLMMLDVPEDGSGAFSAQKKAIQTLCDFAKRHACHVHLVAHPRKGENEQKRPGKMDVAGSSKITDGADNVISVWSAKRDPEDPAYNPEDPDGFVTLYKQRNGDVQERAIAVWLHRESGQFCPTPHRKPIHMVPFELIREEA